MKKKIFFVLIFNLLWFGIIAQTTIFVFDQVNNTPLAGAHVLAVLEDNSNQFKVTDQNGKAIFEETIAGIATFSFLGYQTKQIPILGNTNVYLEKISETLNEFVVTANAVPTRIEDNIYLAKVISNKTIAAKGANNVREALMNELNISLAQDNILGSGLSLNGVGGENIKILIDGVPVIGRLDGNVDVSQLNLNNIEKIEIIEGPMSVNFGSNALGGVINLITKKQQENKVEAIANTYYETVGNYNFDGSVGVKSGKSLITINGGRYFFDGYSPSDRGRWEQWKPKEQYFADIAINRSLKGFNLRVQSKVFREIIQSKGQPLMPFEINASDQYFTTYRLDNSAFLNGFIKPKHHLDITAAYNIFQRHSNTYFKDLVTLEEANTNNNVETFGLAMSRGIYSFVDKESLLNLQLGYELNAETAEGKRIDQAKRNLEEVALFGNMTISLLSEKIQLKPALRYTYNSVYKTIPTPSFNVKLAPTKNLTLRGSYARGFRSPSLKELYFIFVDINHNIYGNENLTPESSHNFIGSINFNQNISKSILKLTLSGFYNSIENQIRSVLITLNADSLLYENQNIAWFKTQGIKSKIELKREIITLGIQHSYTGIKSFVEADVFGENRFVYFNELQANLGVSFPKAKSSFNVFYKLNGKQPILFSSFNSELDREELIIGSINGFSMLDVSYVQPFFKNALVVGLYAKNLLDVDNISQTAGINSGGAHLSASTQLPALWGRSFALKLTYKLSK